MQAHINILGMRKGVEKQVEYNLFFNYKRPPFPIIWKATLLTPSWREEQLKMMDST